MKTVATINTLREFIFARKSRIAAIQKQLNNARTSKEAFELREELAEHEKFISQAKKEIAAFYRPATM